ncbi:4-hydroxy-tetrahydrodipicolinate synthase [Oscillibacter sp. MSJ-2]|uniref:4-hydroxy-tetrahydrodipicolinate synthase n=1 Tax=Dysosmobacter acutus TaxID=2841504 RepID=A0ABS6F8H2_9FIRM|nr:4-hydroxy-tetrahydrodipicolinate synthase [Dysosmobacter acutus]MBU5625660.1 4-hydroxy-tetrahydrodipicolinate synthase [Dysosmobacter acutus]
MSKEIFRGIATALITPFNDKGVDYESYGRLIDWQIESGIDALVSCGTTGESPTLSVEEHKEVIRFAVERVAGRVPLVAGTGSNCTESAIELTEFASEVGADGALVVTPYYNKATQNGLVAHFTAIADKSKIPLILYNVPSRTGCGILPQTYLKLARHERIQAIKEANGDISRIVETAALIQGKLDLYSGNDDQIVPILSVGGIGCISVLSNVLPRETTEICRRYFAGDAAGAAALQFQYLELIHALFCEVNPIPVKTALAAMGMCGGELRLPMTPMEEPNRQRLLKAMREQGLRV